uniref:Uncharacterized protein LOC105049174 n=1 Tax=Elaeis guineensis var. tenera TaxID=51953 RepID=A0A6I9RR49_ELAGV|nr:uncharacterized protein LOC105049174 [Elaeis guineensis]
MGAGSLRQRRLHPDSYGSRVPTPKETSPGLLREPGSTAKEGFTRTPTGAGSRRKEGFTRTPTGAGSRRKEDFTRTPTGARSRRKEDFTQTPTGAGSRRKEGFTRTPTGAGSHRKEGFTRTPTEVGFLRQGRLRPDSHGSWAPSATPAAGVNNGGETRPHDKDG